MHKKKRLTSFKCKIYNERTKNKESRKMQGQTNNYLLQDEKVIHKLNANKRAIIGPLTPILALIFVVMIGIILIICLTQKPPVVSPDNTIVPVQQSPIGIIVMVAIVVLSPIVPLTILLIKKKNRLWTLNVVLTNKKIIANVNNSSVNLPLEQIVSTIITRSAYGKIFNYDKLVIISSRQTLKFWGVGNASEFVNALQNVIEENKKIA